MIRDVAGMLCLLLALPLVAQAVDLGDPRSVNQLLYHDGNADGKKFTGSAGEIVAFRLPTSDRRIAGLRIFGSQFGALSQAGDFEIFFLDAKTNQIVASETARNSLFSRGLEQWVQVKFTQPIKVPVDFKVALKFSSSRDKGVTVGYDTSTRGKYSQVGAPGAARKVDFGGDWMIEVMLTK